MNKNILLPLLAILFFVGIIAITFSNWIGFIIILALLIFISIKVAEYRFPTSILLAFLVSFFLYQLTNRFIDNFEVSRELRILLNRALLIIIVVGLCVVHLLNKKKLLFFNNKIEWNHHMKMPFHTIQISHFLLIGVLISGASFVPFTLQQEPHHLQSILLFCLLFSLINAILEEVIWRGIMLASLKAHASVTMAIMMTSIGFGLLHLSIGFSLIVSLLFSLGGLFYAFVVLKTNSLYPAILFHFVINVGMVLSGMIL
jgi:uncharacterized protein